MTHYLRQFAVLSCLALCTLFSGCRQILVGNNLSNGQITELSAEAAAQLQSQYIPADPSTPGIDEYNRAANVVSNAATGLPVFSKLRFQTIETPEQLSISLPDGQIFVSSGLLELLAPDPAAIDGLIAHEVGHVALQHDIKNLTSALGQDSLNDMLAQGRYQDVVNTELEIAKLSYSRDQEFGADDYGVLLCKKAGLNPDGLADLVEIVNKQDQGPDTVTWDLSHPTGHGRLARLDRELQRHRNGGNRP
jgi:predicted Zn-dependent protease